MKRERIFGQKIIMKKRFANLLPLYGVLPILCSVIFNSIVYYGCRLLNTHRVHYDLSIPFLDGRIPFVRWAVLFYVLSYLFWAVGFVVIARENRRVCYDIFAGELIAKVFCLFLFLALPTQMAEWPSGTFVPENGFDRLLQLIYDMDRPDNLFPSIHCLESWIVFRGSLRCRKAGTPYRVFCFLMSLAVFASTLLVKQHVLIDVIGGVAVAELGLFVAGKLRAGRIYPFLERRRTLGT